MLDKLDELAKAATPGEWHAPGLYEIHNADCRIIGDTNPYNNDQGDAFTEDQCHSNAYFVAAANPSTILRLVRVARAAKVILSHLDEGARPDQIALDELRAALKETI
jgi:hypothetical protein